MMALFTEEARMAPDYGEKVEAATKEIYRELAEVARKLKVVTL
jgi:hypothetical protein